MRISDSDDGIPTPPSADSDIEIVDPDPPPRSSPRRRQPTERLIQQQLEQEQAQAQARSPLRRGGRSPARSSNASPSRRGISNAPPPRRTVSFQEGHQARVESEGEGEDMRATDAQGRPITAIGGNEVQTLTPSRVARGDAARNILGLRSGGMLQVIGVTPSSQPQTASGLRPPALAPLSRVLPSDAASTSSAVPGQTEGYRILVALLPDNERALRVPFDRAQWSELFTEQWPLTPHDGGMSAQSSVTQTGSLSGSSIVRDFTKRFRKILLSVQRDERETEEVRALTAHYAVRLDDEPEKKARLLEALTKEVTDTMAEGAWRWEAFEQMPEETWTVFGPEWSGEPEERSQVLSEDRRRSAWLGVWDAEVEKHRDEVAEEDWDYEASGAVLQRPFRPPTDFFTRLAPTGGTATGGPTIGGPPAGGSTGLPPSQFTQGQDGLYD